MEYESDGDTSCDRYTWNNPQRIGRLGNKRTSQDYPGYNITKIGLNTEKTPGDLRNTSHSNSNEKPSANAAAKNSQRSTIIINSLEFQVIYGAKRKLVIK